MNEMLLRGCMLKNSGAILGLVVYTGRESRIQMNAARTPNKVGSFDRFLNLQIGLVIAFQLALVIFCAAANLVWQNTMGVNRYYLALDQNVQVRRMVGAGGRTGRSVWRGTRVCVARGSQRRLKNASRVEHG